MEVKQKDYITSSEGENNGSDVFFLKQLPVCSYILVTTVASY